MKVTKLDFIHYFLWIFYLVMAPVLVVSEGVIWYKIHKIEILIKEIRK